MNSYFFDHMKHERSVNRRKVVDFNTVCFDSLGNQSILGNTFRVGDIHKVRSSSHYQTYCKEDYNKKSGNVQNFAAYRSITITNYNVSN